MPHLRLNGSDAPLRAALNNGMCCPMAHQDAFALLLLKYVGSGAA